MAYADPQALGGRATPLLRPLESAADIELRPVSLLPAAAAHPRQGTWFDPPAWGPSGGEAYRYTHDQPQWCADPHGNETAMQDPYGVERECTGCRKMKGDCVCAVCKVCLVAVGRGTRKHCRKCWAPTCGSCRGRQRHLNALAWTSTLEPVCDTCAVPRALPLVSDDTARYPGLALLRDAMDFPRRCVNAPRCSALTYRPMCPSCSLPTVPAQPHVERLVRFEYCRGCSWSKKCVKCSNATQRMDQHEQRVTQERADAFRALSVADVDAAFGGAVAGMFHGADEAATRDVLLAALCSSVCYEYGAYPSTTLAQSDVPYAGLVSLTQCKQDYSVFEGPADAVFIAFPGTHDLRTAVTDVKFTRVDEQVWGTVHNGVVLARPAESAAELAAMVAGTASIPTTAAHGGIARQWSYRVHGGFYEESQKLRLSLPTAACRDYLCLRSAAPKRLVFCGHSLGGALAMLSTLRVLTDDLAAFGGRVSCVTFGAPLVGNTALATRVARSGWAGAFHHVVYRSDIVPRLLTERQAHRHAYMAAKQVVQERASGIAAAAASLFSRLPGAAAGKAAAETTAAVASTAAATAASTAAGAVESTKAALARPTPETPVDDLCDSFAGPEAEGADGDGDGDAEVDPAVTPTKGQRGVVLSKRAFDCFGRYHFLQRAAGPYASTADSTEAFTELRSGGGVSLDIRDHLLDSYNRALALALRRAGAQDGV